MRALRTLFGIFSIIVSVVLFMMFLAIYLVFFVYIFGGSGGTLPYTVTPAYLIMPPILLVAGITGMAGRRSKVVAIIAGVLYLAAGIVGIVFGPIALGVIYVGIALFFIIGGIFQHGKLKTRAEKKMEQQRAAQAAYKYPPQPAFTPQPPVSQPVSGPVIPAPTAVWACQCGAENPESAKFCQNCGRPRGS